MLNRLTLVLKIFLFINLYVLIFLIGYGFGSGEFSYGKVENSLFGNDGDYDCLNSSLLGAVDCLNDDFKSWYVYNEEMVGKTMSFEELKESGGVCTHATAWYKYQLDNLGFSTHEITIRPLNKSNYGHRFLVTWDYNLNTYCIIDQLSYDCVRMK